MTAGLTGCAPARLGRGCPVCRSAAHPCHCEDQERSMNAPTCDVASCSRPAPGMMGLCNRHADEYDCTGLWPERYCQTCDLNYCRPGEVECISCQEDEQ